MTDDPQRRLAAIVAADVANYSRLVGIDEEGTVGRLRALRSELIDPVLSRHRGRIANTAGDSLLIEFASVVDAVRSAIEIQEAMPRQGADLPEDRRIALRIGIHVGDVLTDGSDLMGDGVNIAARIEGLCLPGSILLSDSAYAQVRDRLEDGWKDAGRHLVKNISRPVQVWAWNSGGPIEDNEAETRPSIAVLAFDNLSADPEQTYFADGIAEDIITDLSKISGLMVIARNSSFAYRGTNPDIRQVCRDLGVRYVLEGSVRRAGNRVRVTAQMIEGATGSHVWADRFDRDLADIFDVQDEVTGEIVAALRVHLTAGEREALGSRERIDADVYDVWLRGRELIYSFRPEAYVESRRLLNKALESAPDLARLHAQLSLIDLTERLNGWNGATDASFRTARTHAERACALDPDDPENWHARALAHLWLREHDLAEEAARRAVELNPNYAGAQIVMGQIMDMTGRHEAALDWVERGLKLDPLYHLGLQLKGRALFALGRYREMIRTLEQRLILFPNSDTSRMFLAAAHGMLDETDAARKRWAELEEINPDFSVDRQRASFAYRSAEVMNRVVEGLQRAGVG